jgi:hypothetical protein
MTQSIDFQNGGNLFNIDLDVSGDLNFNANGVGGGGQRRLSIADANGQLTIGGAGQFGALQLLSNNDQNTIFIGAGGTEANAILGGGNPGLNGTVTLVNSQGLRTVNMQASVGNITLGADPSGGAPGRDGDLFLRDGTGGVSIQLSGSDGSIRGVQVLEFSDVRLKQSVAPLLNALDKVTALRGVRYQWKKDHTRSECSGGSQIGFIGQEVETVCPELVATDTEGYKSLNYSRMTAILVEAMKEQQQLIQKQASALVEALRRIAKIETTLEARNA